MEEDDKNPQQGGGGAAGVRIFLKSYGAGGAAIWRGDLGGNLLPGQIPGGVPGPGGAEADGEAPVAEN